MSRISTWHADCKSMHACRNAKCWTPNRLLDIEEQSRFRLCLPRVEQIPISEYTTLSYRWGSYRSDRELTTQNLETLRSGLPISVLPRAFQDAMIVTRELGVRFLWIDALCILQDGVDDFHRECAQMSEVYARSSCNIVATFGQDARESLFQSRCLAKVEIGRVTGARYSKHEGHRWTDHDAIVSVDYTRDELHGSEIYSRGWIMQELLLAPRTLLFGRNQVHWQCAELEACEIWPSGVFPRGIFSTLMDAGFSKMNFTGGQAFDNWARIVERYTRLDLSKEKDRLVAISGIARSVQNQTQDKYFAGHWSSSFLDSLLWIAWQDPRGSSKVPGVHSSRLFLRRP